MRHSLLNAGALLPMLWSAALLGAEQADIPKVTIRSDSLPFITAALRAEAESAGLAFAKANEHIVFFTKAVGRQSIRGRLVPITLEVTFHLENAKPGTRIVPTEELVADLGPGIDERRHPNPKDRAAIYMEILSRTKAKVERAATDSLPSQSPSDTQ